VLFKRFRASMSHLAQDEIRTRVQLRVSPVQRLGVRFFAVA
jgi:hypothetical protein